MGDTEAHWQAVWDEREPDAVSWYQDEPRTSVQMIGDTGVDKDARIVDVGGGASTLVDRLLAAGYADLTVVDIAERALERARARLGDRAAQVHWQQADVTEGVPGGPYDVWHDRAVFHFLTDPPARAAYARAVDRAVAGDGHVIIAAFSPEGPDRCSGLPVQRHDATSIGAALGPAFTLVDEVREAHRTPWDGEQRFVFARFRRRL